MTFPYSISDTHASVNCGLQLQVFSQPLGIDEINHHEVQVWSKIFLIQRSLFGTDVDFVNLYCEQCTLLLHS